MSSGSVVVVGGGLAGLVCAWRLRRAGHEVEVLEREAEPGGRWRAERCEGFAIERRDPLCWSGDASLHASARALGIEARLQPLAVPRVGVLVEGRLRSFVLGGRAAPLLAAASLPPRAALRVLGEAWWRARRLRPSTAAGLDHESLADWGRRVVGEDTFERCLAPFAALGLGSDPEQVSRGHALLQLRRLRDGGRPLVLEGGAEVLLGALRRRVEVRTGCEVVQVETQAAGARLRYRSRGRERSVLADAAVLAVPPAEVLRVAPKLAPAERGFFEEVDCGPQLGVELLLDRPPAGVRHYVLSDGGGRGRDVRSVRAAHLRPGLAPAGAGLLSVRVSAAAALRLWKAPDAAVLDCVREGLARLPWGAPEARRVLVWRDPAGEPRFGAGSLGRLARFGARVERSPRLAFAGGGLLGPGVEAALTRGMRAATEVARQL